MSSTPASTSPSTRPAYRKPWTHGAKAYAEADTFEAAKEGMKRRRNGVIFHMPNDGEAGDQTCVFCGGILREVALPVTRDMGNGVKTTNSASMSTKPDTHSTWKYLPVTKSIAGGMHYICSWSALMGAIYSQARF